MAMNTCEKFYWVVDHTGFGLKEAQANIEIYPQMVNPSNNTVEEDMTLNTKLQWWIEVNKLDNKEDKHDTHFWNLDCGGDSIDEAVDTLYKKVLEQYGEYTE